MPFLFGVKKFIHDNTSDTICVKTHAAQRLRKLRKRWLSDGTVFGDYGGSIISFNFYSIVVLATSRIVLVKQNSIHVQ